MSNEDAADRTKAGRGTGTTGAKKTGAKRTGARKTGGGSAKARRKAARLSAVQALYQIDLTGTDVEPVIGEFIKLRLGQEIDGDVFVAADPQLFTDIVRGAAYRRAEVDGLVTAALSPKFPLDRVELLLRAIFRAGAYELFAHHDVHPRILISEYVDVAHAFFAGREPGMVNGVLDHIARVVRADDLQKPDTGRAPADEG